MSKISTWMPLYIGDYLADTMRLSTVEHGAYLLLLMEYWRQGPLDNDDKALAGIAKLDRKVWEREVGPAVRRFFVLQDDGLLHQKRVDAERNKASINSAKKQAAAQARWDKDDAHQNAGGDPSGGANGHAYASACASQEDEQTACPYAGVPPSPSSSTEKKNKAPSLRSVPQKRRERLRDDWAPSEAGERFAQDQGLDIRSEAQKFRNHHTAKGSLMADWDAAWRTWCGNAQRFAPKAKPLPGQSPLDLMIRAERMAKAAREEPPTDYPRITAH